MRVETGLRVLPDASGPTSTDAAGRVQGWCEKRAARKDSHVTSKQFVSGLGEDSWEKQGEGVENVEERCQRSGHPVIRSPSVFFSIGLLSFTFPAFPSFYPLGPCAHSAAASA